LGYPSLTHTGLILNQLTYCIHPRFIHHFLHLKMMLKLLAISPNIEPGPSSSGFGSLFSCRIWHFGGAQALFKPQDFLASHIHSIAVDHQELDAKILEAVQVPHLAH
jgi:hypothetical protein